MLMKKSFLLGFAAMLLPLTSWAQTKFTVTVTPKTDKTFVYAGDATEDNVEVKVTMQVGEEQPTELTKDTEFKVVSYHNETTGDDFLRNAGKYTVTVQGVDAYRGYVIPAGEFTIERAELKNLTFSAGEKEYGATLADADLSGAITITEENGLLTGQDDQPGELKNALSCLTLTYASNGGKETVGENNIVIVKGLEDAENLSNYCYKEEGAPIYLKITPKVLTATLANATSVYKGEEITLAELTTLAINQEDIVGEDDVKVKFTSVKDGKTLKNVGEYKLVAELDGDNSGNYTLANGGEIDYEITRATLEIEQAEGESLKKTYDGTLGLNGSRNLTSLYKVSSETVAGVTFESLGLSMQAEVSGATGMNKGKYLVHPNNGVKDLGTRFYDNPEDGIQGETELSNYKISYDRENLQFEIEAKTVKYYFTSKGQGYNGSVVASLPEDGYAVETDKDNDFVGDDTWTNKPEAKFNYTGEIKNVGEYPLTYTSEVEATGNYKFEFMNEETVVGETKINVYPITQAPLTIAVAEVEPLDFDADRDYDALAEEWASYSAKKVNITGAKGSDGQPLRRSFTLKFQPKEEGMNVGDSGEYDIVIEKVADDDLADADKIVIENYDITTKNGSLTIKTVSDEITLIGWEDDETETTVAETLKKYAGATLETVTITDLTNYVGSVGEDGNYQYTQADHAFVPGHWYTMVLPFEVKLSELSTQLGYAVFYTPNAEKTKVAADSWSDIYFSITFDKIPANTMMLFRVDGSNEDIADGLTFNKKKIVTLTEEESENGIEINNGIKYVPVYAKKELTGEDYYTEWFMRTTDGKFLGVTALREAEVAEGLDVYPFNAYITTPKPNAPTYVRFFIENSDGSTTAISAVTGDTINNYNAEGWYTIGGVKLNGEPTQKGIYINNGKKVVIK